MLVERMKSEVALVRRLSTCTQVRVSVDSDKVFADT